MPIAPQLHEFVTAELAGSAALIARGVGATLTVLRDAKPMGLGPAERAMQSDLAGLLQRHAAAYEATFAESLADRVHAELDRGDGGRGMSPPSGLGGLTLMDESRVDIDIEISRATQLIDAAAEWELRELQTFTSTLIGQAHVSAESNPLRPMLYAAALWDAACVVHAGQGQRAVLLQASTVACAPLLKSAWAAAATRLESQGVTPGAYRSRVIPSGLPVAAPAPDESRHADLSTAIGKLLAAMPAAESEVRIVPGRLAGSAPPAAGVTKSPAAALSPASEAALQSLAELLQRLPPTALSKAQAAEIAAQMAPHRAALAANSTATNQARIVELLARIFDAILADPELHAAFVATVAQLQIAALRVAVRDPSALASSRHPVWQLLDRIGQASATYPQPGDPRSAALLALCQRLAEELNKHRGVDAEFFRKAVDKLDQFLGAQWQAQTKAADRQVQVLRNAEKLERLEQALSQRLHEQMAALSPSPGVRRFLMGPWARVLAASILQHGETEEPSRGYIRLVDDLLWSVQSPDHPASRQRLAAMLPGLLQLLRTGMASIALPQAEQTALLEELMHIHTAALRRGDVEGSALTSAQVVQQMRVDVLPREAPSALESVIDVGTLQTVPAELMPTESEKPTGDASARMVGALRPADRRRMFVNGRWSRVQLLWRSDQGEIYLFAGEIAGETHAITRRALERLAAAGLLRPLEDKPLSQRAIDAVERRIVLSSGALG